MAAPDLLLAADHSDEARFGANQGVRALLVELVAARDNHAIARGTHARREAGEQLGEGLCDDLVGVWKALAVRMGVAIVADHHAEPSDRCDA